MQLLLPALVTQISKYSIIEIGGFYYVKMLLWLCLFQKLSGIPNLINIIMVYNGMTISFLSAH